MVQLTPTAYSESDEVDALLQGRLSGFVDWPSSISNDDGRARAEVVTSAPPASASKVTCLPSCAVTTTFSMDWELVDVFVMADSPSKGVSTSCALGEGESHTFAVLGVI